MSDPTQPIGKIKPQTLNSLPIPVGTVLVDDPVALVDDPVALTGSQTTQIAPLRASANSNAPVGAINRRR